MSQRAGDRMMLLIERSLAIVFIAAVCLNFANVIGRYVFGRSILAADEIQIFVMVWLAFLGAVVVTWRNRHLRVDVVINVLPVVLRRLVTVVEVLLFAALAGFVVVHSVAYVQLIAAIGRVSDTAGIPMWIPHAAIPLGFGLMLLALLWRGGLVLYRRWAEPRAAGQRDDKP